MAYVEDAEDAYKPPQDEEEEETPKAGLDPYVEELLRMSGVEPSIITRANEIAAGESGPADVTAKDVQRSDVGGTTVSSYGPESGKQFIHGTYDPRGEAYQNIGAYADYLYGDNPDFSINVFERDNPTGGTDWAGAAMAGRVPYTALFFPNNYGGFYDAPGASVLDKVFGGGESVNAGSRSPYTMQHELTHAMFPRIEQSYNQAMGDAAAEVAARKTLMPDTAEGQQTSVHPSTMNAYNAAQALRYYAQTNPADVQALLGLPASMGGSPSNPSSAYSEPVAYLSDPGLVGGTYDGRTYPSDLKAKQQADAMAWLLAARNYAKGVGR